MSKKFRDAMRPDTTSTSTHSYMYKSLVLHCKVYGRIAVEIQLT